jgi:hypothetical protein
LQGAGVEHSEDLSERVVGWCFEVSSWSSSDVSGYDVSTLSFSEDVSESFSEFFF